MFLKEVISSRSGLRLSDQKYSNSHSSSLQCHTILHKSF